MKDLQLVVAKRFWAVGLWVCCIVGLWDLGCEGRLGSADAGPYSAGGSAGGKYKELIEEVFSNQIKITVGVFFDKHSSLEVCGYSN